MLQKVYRIIGLMSGTSLDGVDIVYVEITKDQANCWDFKLIHGETIPYSDSMEEALRNAVSFPATKLLDLDNSLGCYFGEVVNDFIQKHKINRDEVDFISSHGHTIFHQPEKGLTLQIGSGICLSIESKLKVIANFRQKDVALGGQGAPLVPVGDKLLFANKAEAFLNIGGFANISFDKEGVTSAFDICPGNLVLNKLTQTIGLKFDEGGNIARGGELNFFLLDLLNNLPYYKLEKPKSLGVEWLQSEFYPLIKSDKEVASNLRTLVEHVAFQIAQVLNVEEVGSVLITGGGAFNTFLIERIQHYYEGKVLVPDADVVNFKEAIVFAFLGVLFEENIPNCLSSVTGAIRDSVGGVVYFPN
jgi:anhydro-N-acetylmuramic acid kinase